MLDSFWNKLKSGSDIRAVATDDIEGQKIELTNDVVEKICLAFVQWLSDKFSLPCKLVSVAVGHDCRTSALRIKNGAINALRSTGATVYDCSLSSTPAMFTAVSTMSCTASIQITASHHPKNMNGFKFFTSSGGLSANDVENILEMAQNSIFPPAAALGSVRAIDTMSFYCEKLKKTITEGIKFSSDKPLSGFKIVVDAGNGVGGFFADKILTPLGADTTGSMFLEPDGNFPNHAPNPEDNAALRAIKDATVSASADLGIVFDTDVDRVAVVDSSGQVISASRLIALASSIALKSGEPGIIVTDCVTSDNLKDFIKNLGGMQFRYKRGYHNVISLAKKINEQGENCPLAIETSGHAAFKENNFIDDGAFLAAKIIIEMANLRTQNKTLSDSISEFENAKEINSFRFNLLEAESAGIISKEILDGFRSVIKSSEYFSIDNENLEGVRSTFRIGDKHGWLLMRKSIHDAALILYIESYALGGIKAVLEVLYPFFKKQESINSQTLEQFLSGGVV